MATVNISATFCDGGGHAHTTVAVNGGQDRNYALDTDDLRTSIDPAQIEIALKLLIRLHCQGMTRAQAASALTNGIVVTTAGAS